MMEGGQHGFELPAYGNQTKECTKTWKVSYIRIIIYIKESLCVVRSCYSLCKVVFVH